MADHEPTATLTPPAVKPNKCRWTVSHQQQLPMLKKKNTKIFFKKFYILLFAYQQPRQLSAYQIWHVLTMCTSHRKQLSSVKQQTHCVSPWWMPWHPHPDHRQSVKCWISMLQEGIQHQKHSTDNIVSRQKQSTRNINVDHFIYHQAS